MRALIADDEEPARRRLIRQLETLGGIEVVGEAADGLETLARVRSLQPEVLFLDVRMPALDGLAVASHHVALMPIVFTTAYDEFAVQAFDVDAVDYLLKPIALERLAEAVARVRLRAQAETERIAVALRGHGGRPVALVPRVSAQWRGALHFFDARGVARFYALDKYTAFLIDGQEHLTQESLNTLAERLGPHGFLRVHRSELANLMRVRTLHGGENGYELEFTDGQRSRVSRRFSAALKGALGVF